MRLRTVVVSALVVVAVGTYVFLDADPEGRAELWNRVTTAFGGTNEPAPVPNWGDVAQRIGQFTDEERALRDVLAPAIAADVPTPETPPPVVDPAAAPPAPVVGAPAVDANPAAPKP